MILLSSKSSVPKQEEKINAFASNEKKERQPAFFLKETTIASLF